MGMQYEREMHLFRGAPAVRQWSKYRKTVETWTLCGINRRRRDPAETTEDAHQVTCRYCLDLMQPKSYDRDRKARAPNA